MKKPMAVKFKLPRGCSVESIHIRETTGRDEERAVVLAKQKGEKGSFLDEMVRLSVVKVDDEPVEQPFQDIVDWNSKTRSFALKAYLRVNGAQEEEEKDFFESAEMCEGSANTTTIDEIIGSAG